VSQCHAPPTPPNTAIARSRASRRTGKGGTLLGVFIGLVVGLGLAAGVAYYLMKANGPFPAQGGSRDAREMPKSPVRRLRPRQACEFRFPRVSASALRRKRSVGLHEVIRDTGREAKTHDQPMKTPSSVPPFPVRRDARDRAMAGIGRELAARGIGSLRCVNSLRHLIAWLRCVTSLRHFVASLRCVS